MYAHYNPCNICVGFILETPPPKQARLYVVYKAMKETIASSYITWLWFAELFNILHKLPEPLKGQLSFFFLMSKTMLEEMTQRILTPQMISTKHGNWETSVQLITYSRSPLQPYIQCCWFTPYFHSKIQTLKDVLLYSTRPIRVFGPHDPKNSNMSFRFARSLQNIVIEIESEQWSSVCNIPARALHTQDMWGICSIIV